jgi:hypothetical protein
MSVADEGESPFGLLAAKGRSFEETDEALGEVAWRSSASEWQRERIGHGFGKAPHGGRDDWNAAGLSLEGREAKGFSMRGGHKNIHGGVGEDLGLFVGKKAEVPPW